MNLFNVVCFMSGRLCVILDGATVIRAGATLILIATIQIPVGDLISPNTDLNRRYADPVTVIKGNAS